MTAMPLATDPRAAAPQVVTAFVDGEFRAPRGHEIPVVYPADESVVGVLRESDAAEVDAAVAAARRAFETGPWRRMSVERRQEVLLRVHDGIMAAADELAVLECLNTGIPLAQVRRMHIPRAAQNFRFFAEYVGQAGGDAYRQEEGFLTLVVRDPIGVCALIGPWNVPLGLTSMKVAACIAFGNSCVVKPSEMTPLAVRRFCEILRDAGVPPGVVNVVNGRGGVTGSALVGHPGIDMISFTGGTATGRAILAAAAKGIKGAAMELGGKSANIVFADADAERALDGALMGVFANNGQMCLAGSRIFVERPIADEFVERFAARTAALRVRDPMDPAAEIGPMVSAAQRDRILEYADVARAEGCTVLTGGRAHPGFGRGFWLEPAAVLARDNAARVCREEIFGPFATLQVFDSEDEVVAKANDSEFGLAGYVWTENLRRAHRVAGALRTGTVWVNTPMVRDLRSAFGGYKESGLGREGGKGCEAMYTEEKTVMVAVEPRPLPKLGAG